MTKLGNMDLPKKNQPMFYCQRCKEYVPNEKKHNRKRHKNEK